jgi:hypothetical protein
MGFARAHPQHVVPRTHRARSPIRGAGQHAGMADTLVTPQWMAGELRLRTPAGASRRMALRDTLDAEDRVAAKRALERWALLIRF